MAFNTTSFIAGVGSVVVVLSTGFAGGYFIANPTKIDPPNRLQRLAAEDRGTAPAPASTVTKPEVVAAATPVAAPPAAVVVPAAAAPAEPAQQAALQPAASSVPVASPAETRAPEPAQTLAVKETTPSAIDKERSTEARFVERKRSDARKVAEQQRKQRELEVATVAVRRIIHERDGQDVIIRDRDAPEMVENDAPATSAPVMPHFNLFGQ